MLQSTVTSSTAVPRSHAEGYRIPPAPRPVVRKWIPAGEVVSIFGIPVPGPFYVGSADASANGDIEPSMIDPISPVAVANESYYPNRALWINYNQTLSQHERRGYLLWMAGGRQSKEIDARLLFMYFHGLERRAVLEAPSDPAARESLPEIVAELRRLDEVYGEREAAFRNAIFCLLYWIEHRGSPVRLYAQKDAAFHRFAGVRTYTQVAVGQCIEDGVPLGPRIAQSWLLNEGRTYNKEAAQLFRRLFEALFDDLYAGTFGNGIVLPAVPKRLQIAYRPASPALMNHPDLVRELADVADPEPAMGALDRIKRVFDAATEEIERYAKIMARRPESIGTLEVLSQLPMRLWPAATKDALRALIARAASDSPVMTVRELLLAIDATAQPNKSSALLGTSILAGVGLVTEPALIDAGRSLKADANVMLLPDAAAAVAKDDLDSYVHATRCVDVACAVMAAGGQVDAAAMSSIRAQVAEWPTASLRAAPRLLARLRLSAQSPMSAAASKKLAEQSSEVQRREIADFVVRAVAAGREPTPAEVKAIGKLYAACGLDQQTVASDLHAAASGRVKPAATGFSLDADRVRALASESERVGALLANIFTRADEEPLEPSPEPVATSPVATDAASSEPACVIAGLDAAHSQFARALVARASWSRSELEAVAQGFDLMLGAAIERINDLCLDAHDQLLVEGDDPIDVDPHLLSQLCWA